MLKDSSMNIRFSSETEIKARALCARIKEVHGVEISLSSYLRGIVERFVEDRYIEVKDEVEACLRKNSIVKDIGPSLTLGLILEKKRKRRNE